MNLHVVEHGQQTPPIFDQMKNYLRKFYPSVIKHWGLMKVLPTINSFWRCDVVVSTALHDFQGLAVLEAVAAGCIPLLPNRLCYGEWFTDSYLYISFDDIDREAEELASKLSALAAVKRQVNGPSCLLLTGFQ